MSGLSREMIIHPGETLREVLEEKNMSQQELAKRTGMSGKHISTVLSGEKGISVSFAKKLEYALSIDADFWIRLQSEYEKEIYEFEEHNLIDEKELKIAKNLSLIYDFLEKHGFIEKTKEPSLRVIELRKFLNISSLMNIPALAFTGAFRVQNTSNVDIYKLFAWQKLSETLAQSQEFSFIEKPLQKELLLQNLSEIKKSMFLPQNQTFKNLQNLFAQCGICFVITPHFKNVPVQGFIKYIPQKGPFLAMTLRQKRVDIFWFTLFHEIGHLIQEDEKQRIDFDFQQSEEKNSSEKKADTFAQNILLNKDDYKNFIQQKDFSLFAIQDFAKKQEVLPCIVIGRLQKENFLSWHAFKSEMIHYSL